MGSDLAALAWLNLVQLVLVEFNSVGKKSGKSAVGSELSHSLHSAADFVGKGKQKGKWLPNKIYNFTARDQALARSPPKWDWSASIILIHSWKHCAVFVHVVAAYQRRCGSNGNIIPELAVEKPPLMEREGEKTGLFQAKVKRTVWARQGF